MWHTILAPTIKRPTTPIAKRRYKFGCSVTSDGLNKTPRHFLNPDMSSDFLTGIISAKLINHRDSCFLDTSCTTLWMQKTVSIVTPSLGLHQAFLTRIDFRDRMMISNPLPLLRWLFAMKRRRKAFLWIKTYIINNFLGDLRLKKYQFKSTIYFAVWRISSRVALPCECPSTTSNEVYWYLQFQQNLPFTMWLEVQCIVCYGI